MVFNSSVLTVWNVSIKRCLDRPEILDRSEFLDRPGFLDRLELLDWSFLTDWSVLADQSVLTDWIDWLLVKIQYISFGELGVGGGWWVYLEYSVSSGPFLRFPMSFEFFSEMFDDSVSETRDPSLTISKCFFLII